MSLYGEDGEVVRGGEVRDEVARQAVKINARREVDTPAVRTLLEWIQEYPKEGEGAQSAVQDVCTWCKVTTLVVSFVSD